LDDVADRAQRNISMLMGWFKVNQVYHEPNGYTYAEFSKYYIWNRRTKEWTRRQKRVCLGRLPFVHPNSRERYYMRMLLSIVRGEKSFDDLRTIDGTKYATFHEACMTLGLVTNKREWDDALNQASTWATGAQLQSIFCSLLTYNEVGLLELLWDKYWKDLSDDLERRLQCEHHNPEYRLSVDQRKNICLYELELIMRKNGHS